ncbi:MAG: RNA polymerase subunit sigma-24, partial [Bradyrhizobium icense]
GRVLISIAPREPEAHGLLALMELNASRAAERTGADGEPVLLMEQDRSRWDFVQIRRGLQALGRSQQLGGEGGFYVLQAEIVACHARAGTADATDWARIAAFYEKLSARAPSPVIELNRAVAVGMAEGSQAGLAIIEAIAHEPALKNYHLLSGVRGDFLQKLGRHAEARAAFETAAALAGNRRDRDLMRRRAREVP